MLYCIFIHCSAIMDAIDESTRNSSWQSVPNVETKYKMASGSALFAVNLSALRRGHRRKFGDGYLAAALLLL